MMMIILWFANDYIRCIQVLRCRKRVVVQNELMDFISRRPEQGETTLDRKAKLQALQTLKEGSLVSPEQLALAKRQILQVSPEP